MFPRSLACVLVVLAISTSVVAAEAVATDEPYACGQQPAGRAVAYQPVEKPAPVATWWANSSLGKFYRSCCRDAKRNNCWPQPFVKADRMAVRETFSRMVANGTVRQNTLGNHHFVGDTGKLNRSGQLKIREILLRGLPYRRDLYIYRTEKSSETAKRVKSVQKYAAMVVRDGVVPPIYETDIPPVGRSAQGYDIVDKKFNESRPDPRLPSQSESDEEQ